MEIETKRAADEQQSSADYDVVVIGSGIGGLTAGALLAKSGKSVLVIEQHDRPGGYAHSFKRKRYVFDSGVHLTSGCGFSGYRGGQVIRKVLQSLEVYEQLEFIRVNPFAHVEYPGLQVDFPLSADAFVSTLAKFFPDQEQGLRQMLELCLAISEQAAIADEVMASKSTVAIQSRLQLLIEHRQATVAEVLDKYISDRNLQSIIASNWPYLGLPPGRLSFVYWAGMLMGYIEDGAWYCKGSFQNLAETLVNGLIGNGGEIRYKCKVDKILVAGNRVQSLRLASGHTIKVTTIISNADVQQTVAQLIGEDLFPPRFVARLNRMQHSLSIFVVYIATSLDMKTLGAHHETFYFDHYDHEVHYTNSAKGKLSWLSITVPTLVDASIAPDGQHLVMLTTLTPHHLYPDWSKAKPEFTAKMLDFASQKIPGLNQNILFVDAGSPATMERYTFNHKGSAYGWDATPEQSGANRLANKSPIGGLYFAGHWAAPGGGIYGVCYSGLQTAQQILGLTGQNEVWRLFNIN